jgi:hypothetical protein
MPLITGLPGYVTASSQTFGIQSGIMPSRFRQIVMSGNVADNVSSGPGPLYPAGGIMVVQSTASLVNQVVTTSAATVNNRALVPHRMLGAVLRSCGTTRPAG